MQVGTKAEAVVIREFGWYAKGRTSYQPTLQFRDANDVLREFRSSTGSSTPQGGKRFSIRYEQAHPERAEIADDLVWQLAMNGLGAIALIALAAALIIYANRLS